MVLFNTAYWNPEAMTFDDPDDKRKQVYPLLRKLATEKHFDDYLLLTDDPEAVVQFSSRTIRQSRRPLAIR